MANIEPNATFYSFRESGKWYATGRGVLTPSVFDSWDSAERRKRIIDANDGKYPGLSGTGAEFIFVVDGDDVLNFGWPLLLFP
jgi:hypothetical protein